MLCALPNQYSNHNNTYYKFKKMNFYNIQFFLLKEILYKQLNVRNQFFNLQSFAMNFTEFFL